MIWQPLYPVSQFSAIQNIATAPSLTEALNQFDSDFRVEVLFLGETSHTPFFKDKLPENQHFFCRNVHLYLHQKPVIWAQSLCLAQSHFWKEILNCGTMPLGKLLFSEQWSFQRSCIEYSIQEQTLFRRSSFTYQNETLYLVEQFLPELTPVLNTLKSIQAA